MREPISIAVTDLLIDEENPRIPQPNVGQREAIRSLAKEQERKLQNLAKDIVAYGLNPSELPIVIKFEEENRYVVVEGNRRLAALRALENPDLLVDAVASSVLSEIRALSRQYQAAPVDSISCIVAKDRDEARHWIELRHTGEREGAALVPWGADDTARFRARSEGLTDIATQALTFLQQRGDITSDFRRHIPVTSYRRLLQTPEVRTKLAVEFEDGKLKLLGAEEDIAASLLWIAQDLESGTTRTEHIYTKKDRVDYANRLPSNVTVTPTRKTGEGIDVSTRIPEHPTKKTPTRKTTKPRDKLIPRDCVLNVTDTRLRDIETELRRLSLTDYSNAVSVLFRVFIELSADAYIDRIKLATSINAKLAAKLQDVTNDLTTRQKLTKQQAIPVRRACQKDSLLAPSVTMMHQYIHNKHVFPGPSDLRASWDSLQPFVIAVWAP